MVPRAGFSSGIDSFASIASVAKRQFACCSLIKLQVSIIVQPARQSLLPRPALLSNYWKNSRIDAASYWLCSNSHPIRGVNWIHSLKRIFIYPVYEQVSLYVIEHSRYYFVWWTNNFFFFLFFSARSLN